MPYVCVNPLATSLALCRSKEPSLLYLFLYTQRHPTVFLPGGSLTISHVLLSSRACSSSYIDFLQTAMELASLKFLGSRL